MDDPQAAELPQPPPMSPRKPWLAALLVLLFSVVGLVYCGRLRRAALWLVAIWTLVILGCAGILYLADSPLAVALWSCLILPLYPALVLDAFFVARRSIEAPRRSYQRVWVYVVLIVALTVVGNVVAYGIRWYWVEAFRMPTGSMANTILAGDRFMVDKLVLHWRPLRHGDVVAYVSQNPGHPIYCKRVIGLPGDIIEIRDEQVIRNGSPLEEPYAKRTGELRVDLAPELVNYGPITVPADAMFLLGDNRRASMDSRFEGPYSIQDVVGVARVVFWSRDYEWIPPKDFRSNPEGEEKWGAIRWSRIGRRLDSP